MSADLLYSDTERALAAALDDLLSSRCSWSDVLAGPIDGLWSAVAADLGCAGLLIGESSGGAGASYREAAVAAEHLGSFVAPVPFLGSAVVATTALLRAGEQGEVLKSLAEGTATAAVAVPFASAPGGSFPEGIRVSGPQPGDSPETVRLRGTVAGVADALSADVLVVPAEGVPRGLYLVEVTGASDVRRTPVVSLDMTRQLCDLSFSDAPARVIATGAVAETALGSALVAGAGMLAAEALGVAQRCLDMTVTYVKERRQFARPVGSFQAVKHRLADVWVLVTQARAASRYAADCLASGDADTAVAVSLAKAFCCDAAVHAAQECVQLHGGIGFTWEHPAHLYLKRAKAASIGFGTPGAHRTSLGTLVDLQPPA